MSIRIDWVCSWNGNYSMLIRHDDMFSLSYNPKPGFFKSFHGVLMPNSWYSRHNLHFHITSFFIFTQFFYDLKVGLYSVFDIFQGFIFGFTL